MKVLDFKNMIKSSDKVGSSKQIVKTTKTTSNKRVVSIDLFRGFLLTMMVVVHFFMILGKPEDFDNPLLLIIEPGLGIWGAAGFLMMMGMSVAFSNDRNNQRNYSELQSKSLMRGFFIIVAGLLIALITDGPALMWAWDILPLIGFATIVIFYLRKVPNWGILLLATLVLLITPWLRGLPFFDNITHIEFHAYPGTEKILSGMYYDPVSWETLMGTLVFNDFVGILKGFIIGGFFGVFPWIAFSLIGYFLGRRVVFGKFRKDIPWIIVVGLLLIIISFCLAYISIGNPTDQIATNYIVPFSMFPDSFSNTLFQAGISITLLAILYYIFDIKYSSTYKPSFIAKIFLRTSNYSLSYYFMHYLVIDIPIIVLSFFDIDIFQSFGTPTVILLTIAGLAMLQVMVIFFNKYKGKYSLEWIMIKSLKLVVKDYQRSISEVK